jgi:hypothetical protein
MSNVPYMELFKSSSVSSVSFVDAALNREDDDPPFSLCLLLRLRLLVSALLGSSSLSVRP